MRCSDACGSHATSSAASPANSLTLGRWPLVELREDLRHPVDVGLAADEAGGGIGVGLGKQMLAAAEADFQPYRRDGGVEQQFGALRCRLGRCRSQAAATATPSGRPDDDAACVPCAGRRTSLARGMLLWIVRSHRRSRHHAGAKLQQMEMQRSRAGAATNFSAGRTVRVLRSARPGRRCCGEVSSC